MNKFDCSSFSPRNVRILLTPLLPAWRNCSGKLNLQIVRKQEESAMARKCFYSFHYQPDCWRASQVRNMGVIEGNQPVTDNDWEAVKKGGDDAIKKWIADQMSGRSCTVVLIGAATAGRKWIDHEIEKTWNDKKGLVGVYIHNLKNKDGYQSSAGANPFSQFKIGETSLGSIVKAYNPPYSSSTDVYKFINDNLAQWADEAAEIRNKY
jgi:hypothetical protein